MINLDIKTEYTEIYGVSPVKNLIQRAKELNQTAIGITDKHHLAGIYDFYDECKKQNIKPIIGIELIFEFEHSLNPILLFAKNNVGLKNLIKLSSKSYLNSYTVNDIVTPILTLDTLSNAQDGLLCLSGGSESYIDKAIIEVGNTGVTKAKAFINSMNELFNDDFYIQIQAPRDISQKLLAKAKLKYQAKGVVANTTLYTLKEQKQYHEERMAIALNQKMYMPTSTTIYSPNLSSMAFRPSLPYDAHLMSELEIDRLLIDAELPYDLIEATDEIGSKIDHTSYFNNIYNKYTIYQKLGGMSSWEGLQNLTEYYLENKFAPNPVPENYKTRLSDELKLIKQMGFSDYMLIVWDYINKISEQGVIIGPGRGSAGCSLVSHLLGITLLDPIEFDLPMARFLNKGRGAQPKIF